MLVLSRKRHESICIGDEITVKIVEVRGDKVRVGIEAPLHIPVHRKEVKDAIENSTGQQIGFRPHDFQSNIAMDSEASLPVGEGSKPSCPSSSQSNDCRASEGRPLSAAA